MNRRVLLRAMTVIFILTRERENCTIFKSYNVNIVIFTRNISYLNSNFLNR